MGTGPASEMEKEEEIGTEKKKEWKREGGDGVWWKGGREWQQQAFMGSRCGSPRFWQGSARLGPTEAGWHQGEGEVSVPQHTCRNGCQGFRGKGTGKDQHTYRTHSAYTLSGSQ